MNEELQSANEELQTSKEELQSVNEELETVNSELKKKLEEIDRANSDLQNLFQSTRIATVFVDRELRIKKFTPAATEVFRLIDGDIGRPIADIAPRFSGGDLMGDIREVLRTLAPRERQVSVEDGPAWYLLRTLPYRTVDDVIDGVVLTFLDITQLKRSEEERGKLADIVESSQDGIIGKTLDGVITSWNAGAEKMYGYKAREAIGRPVDLIVAPECRDQVAEVFERLRKGTKVESFETVRVRKDGQRLDVSITFSPVRDAAGLLVGASGIDRDISERKRTETALREEARRKDEFLAMLGHELRNPLAPVSNCLHVLRSSTTNGQKEKALATIERQVVHLTRLVDDLLDVSRISRGKVLLRKQRVDAAEVVRATVEDLRPGLEGAGLSLSLSLPGSPCWVEGDPTRLSQVVSNVLHNAGKFTERGGRISVGVRRVPEEDSLVVTVSDTGIGMEPNLLARIFEPFSQGDLGPDRGRGGLGLGLALVKALVELHGGSVEAHSPGLGQGSEITLRLPLTPLTPLTTAGEEIDMTGTTEGRSHARRCLVIEDNVDAAESMAMLLSLDGHEAEVAFDAGEGLEKARRFRPNVVLCDIGLPGAMDGYGLARAFRNDPELSSAYLIALTGYGQEEDRRRALEAGFDTHLTKPADLDLLRRLLGGLP